MLVPFPLLWKLQMPRRQKNILIVIFLTPLTAIVFAILRFAFQTTESIGPTINPARLVVYSTLELSFCMYRNSPSYKNDSCCRRVVLTGA